MSVATAAPPATACPRCGGTAPRGFLFCLACAVGLFEADETGRTLYDALVEEYEQLGQRIADGLAVLPTVPDAKRARAEAKLSQWRKQRDSLAYVLNRWEAA